MTLDQCFFALGLIVVISPAVLLAVLAVTSLLDRTISERSSAKLTEASVVVGLVAIVAILVLMLGTGRRHVPIELGNWVVIPQQHFHFHLKFVFDRLSVPFTILSFVLCGIISAFASRYLHREPGYNRFFVLFSVFLLGMVLSSLAGTIETLFFGWELVGLSSALLVAYFHERTNPVRNGQRVWSIYRISDAAFLIAALTLHHLTGAGDFDALMGTGVWPEGHVSITQSHALFVGALLLLAAMGKSALVPFSGWLPRAMEGPTPSSAIFYGALSVHLGAYLLLRVGPLLEASTLLQIAVVFVGLISAIFGTLTARVQTDIKSALAFASLTQVGIIVVEIGCGLRYLALVHIIGHACLRTLQLLRAPTLLHDYHTLENAIGGHLQRNETILARWLPTRLRAGLYATAIERGYLDGSIGDMVVRPFTRLFRWCDNLERRWTNLLSGGQSRESDDVRPHVESLEEFV
ncbi:proton-conducting transporter transmembrane domain-containing protein [Crateriforma conspicua]|uniref:NADH-quinone oxidoreductase subunit 12 n=1 Tax=Crateriforma conspicua TaxID=2527996 RepID=A0A5C5Y3P4_9PLAN|nr:proton-conducting transporter membrane subunit [Crateriforma conspicua]QDV64048.1 NADH-quinone oxidoreductase subunit 12 [Crateriforma conspicua]TWT69429.1 NADH-quinone oxidoreductase subunit 12 [Crateriforma conspicua]